VVVGGVAASVGKDETGAAVHRGVGGAHGVAARRDIVHEIDLAAAKAPKRSFEAVRVRRRRGQVAAVAGALGFGRRGAAERGRNLRGARRGDMAGDVGGKDSVGAGAAVTGRDGNKPARGFDEAGHFAGGGVEVNRGAARVFNRVGQSAGLGFGWRERAVAWVGVFAGGKDFHGRRGLHSWGLALRSVV